jgi:putative ABC transport system permease protein
LARTPGRFIAVFLIIVLGAGFLTGLQSSGPGMSGTADSYFAEKKLADFWLYCDKGISAEDVEAIEALPEVAQASGGYRVDLVATANGETFELSFLSIPTDAAQGGAEALSQLSLVEGRMPTSVNECVADAVGNFQIGDTVIVSEDNWESSLDLMGRQRFTVVGVARSSRYISTERGSTNIGIGYIDQYLYIPEGAFTSDWYTELTVRLNTTEGLSAFSDAYAQTVADEAVALDKLLRTRAEQRYHDISEEVSAELEDGENRLEDEEAQAASELEAAKQQLVDGQMSLDEARAEYERQSKVLADSRKRLDKEKLNLKAAAEELSTQRGALEAGRSQLAAAQTALGEAQALREGLRAALAAEMDPTAQAVLQGQIAALDTQIATAEGQIAAAKGEINWGEQVLASAEVAYANAEAQIQAADRQIAAGATALATYADEIARSAVALDEGQTEYDAQAREAAEGFADARAELDAGWRDWEAIEWPQWTIQDRDDLSGYAGFSAEVDRINSLSLILPWFFFLVAAIVCLTTMTRLVGEHRGQIGTLKANGYRRWQIMVIYQSYAWFIGLAGGAIGVVLGLLVFPPAIWNSYSTLYHMGAFETVVTFGPCAVGLLGGAVALSVATALACRNSLGKNAAELMRPRAPRLGRRVLLERIGFLWRRLSFSRKATIRNLLRYKLRFAVTVIGVAGCTALLVAGFGLRDSVSGIVERQYGGVSSAQATLILEKPSYAAEDTQLNRLLAENAKNGIVFSYARAEDITVTFNDKTSANIPTALFVPEDAKSFVQLMNFRQPVSLEPIAFPLDEPNGAAVVITEQLATALGVRVGDTVSFGPNGAEPVDAKIGAIMENYVFNYLYLTPASYEALVGTPVGYTAVTLRTDLQGDAFETLLSELVSTDNVATALPTSQLKVVMDQVAASLSAVIWLMLLAAFLLAIIVIYNLITINVTERERELATLKVLGYHRREVVAYITREAFVMVFFGILAGLLFGIALHAYVMGVFVSSEIMFPHVIAPLSFVLAAVLPLLCTILVNLCIRPRLSRLSPVTSLKSIE